MSEEMRYYSNLTVQQRDPQGHLGEPEPLFMGPNTITLVGYPEGNFSFEVDVYTIDSLRYERSAANVIAGTARRLSKRQDEIQDIQLLSGRGVELAPISLFANDVCLVFSYSSRP